jgi:hypothetical protein
VSLFVGIHCGEYRRPAERHLSDYNAAVKLETDAKSDRVTILNWKTLASEPGFLYPGLKPCLIIYIKGFPTVQSLIWSTEKKYWQHIKAETLKLKWISEKSQLFRKI